MKCLVCSLNEAIKHEIYGYLPCQSCQDRQAKYSQPNKSVEMTTEAIKSSRKEYKDEIIQPFREGVVSKEYIDIYGTQGINATKQEIKNAKNVWDDLEYYKR